MSAQHTIVYIFRAQTRANRAELRNYMERAFKRKEVILFACSCYRHYPMLYCLPPSPCSVAYMRRKTPKSINHRICLFGSFLCGRGTIIRITSTTTAAQFQSQQQQQQQQRKNKHLTREEHVCLSLCVWAVCVYERESRSHEIFTGF